MRLLQDWLHPGQLLQAAPPPQHGSGLALGQIQQLREKIFDWFYVLKNISAHGDAAGLGASRLEQPEHAEQVPADVHLQLEVLVTELVVAVALKQLIIFIKTKLEEKTNFIDFYSTN